MALELKHLAPYLPYKLKMEFLDFPLGKHYRFLELDCGHDFHFYFSQNKVRPILRLLSDLTKEIEVNGEKFVPIEFFREHYTDHLVKFEKPDCIVLEDSYSLSQNVLGAPFAIIEKLFEWHFDVFGLIEKGLAIDINTWNK